MDAYEVTFRDGRASKRFAFFSSARAWIIELYPDAVIGHVGDMRDGGTRTNFWASAADNHSEAPPIGAIEQL